MNLAPMALVLLHGEGSYGGVVMALVGAVVVAVVVVAWVAGRR